MELLKQGVYSPVSAEAQICAIYAGSKGYLDGIAVEKVGSFESDLYNVLEEEKTILESIRNEKVISDETERKL